MVAGIVHQHVQPLVAGKNFSHRRFPGFRPGHVQRNAKTTAGILPGQFVSVLTMDINTEPDVIVWRLLKKGLCGRLAETAIGTGNQNDAQAHGLMLPALAPGDKF
jgi:hypothetical protein